MKNLISIFLLCLTLVACDNPVASLNTVRNAFPGSEVYVIPQQEFIYLIKKPDGSVWSIQCQTDSVWLDKKSIENLNTLATPIFPAQK